jgi:hypothetical protein
MSLPKRERERALQALMAWCWSELQGTEPGRQGLDKLGFGSAEALRIQLKNWGFPEWLLEGTSAPKGQPARKRKAKTTGGPVQELPPSKEAAPLFEEALDKLRYALRVLVYLQEGARRTPECLQDGRFIQATREEAPPWGPDLPGRTRIAGVTQAPGNGLTELIATYLVAGGDPEPLIEKLHYNPEELDREKLHKVLYGDKKNNKPGLLTRVVQAARLIRGADVEGGASTGEFGVDEMIARHRILDMRAAGLSDPEIIERLSQEGTPISMADLKRLAALDLPDPPR